EEPVADVDRGGGRVLQLHPITGRRAGGAVGQDLVDDDGPGVDAGVGGAGRAAERHARPPAGGGAERGVGGVGVDGDQREPVAVGVAVPAVLVDEIFHRLPEGAGERELVGGV